MGEEVGAPPCTPTPAFQLLFRQKRWRARREGLHLAEFPIAVPSKEPSERAQASDPPSWVPGVALFQSISMCGMGAWALPSSSGEETIYPPSWERDPPKVPE